MPAPLRIATIEPKPKRIHRSSSWRDTVGLSRHPELAQAFTEIITCIQAGRPLPTRFYRASQNPDTLLEQDGTIHLHLGNPGTRELLFLRQYADDVVLLEISDHYHFATDPVGTVLRTLHDSKVQQWEIDKDNEVAAAQAKETQASVDKNADIRARLGLAKKNESWPDMREFMDIIVEGQRSKSNGKGH